MFNKLIINLSVIGLLAAALSACTINHAECQQDSDCLSDQYCAGGGGVFFEGGICVDKDRAPDNDITDASSDVTDDATSEDTSTSSDASFSDVPPDNQDDVDESDTDDFDTTPPPQCTRDEQCEPPSEGGWGECTFELPCDTEGVQKREVHTAACENNVCVSSTTTEEEQACTRPSTNGQSCGTATESNWSICFNPNVCATSGTQTRQISTKSCANNACATDITTETRNCSLVPAPTCGNVTHSAWSTCTYPSPCANSGTQTRTRTTPTCNNGTCSGVNTTETQECGARNTNDTACGEQKLVKSGTCTYLGECDTFGETTPAQYTTPVCSAGTCSGQKVDYLHPNCSRNTNGTPCGGHNSSRTCNHGCCGICQ